MSPTKVTRGCPTPRGRAATMEVELFPPNPELAEITPLEPDHLEGPTLRMTQAMNHYQRKEHCCFVWGDPGHFTWECPHHKAFCTWNKQH